MTRLFGGALCATAIMLATMPADAHITFEKSDAASKSFYKAVLRVPHGCSGSATTAITVTIPEGIAGVKPMPKPGWTLAITKGDYAKSYDFMHGKLASGAKEITWKNGVLSDDEYDEFVFQAYVTEAFPVGSTVAFPVTQTCESGSERWVDLPGAAHDPNAEGHPAPTLHIGASDPMSSMHHH